MKITPFLARQLVAGLGARRHPDVGEEAILAGFQLAEVMVQRGGAQRNGAVGDLAVGIVDARPWLDGHGFVPAQLAHRRRCEGYAQIGLHAAVQQGTGQLAALDGDGIGRNRIHHARLRAHGEQRECSAANQSLQATHKSSGTFGVL
jgi:hypothetical protein